MVILSNCVVMVTSKAVPVQSVYTADNSLAARCISPKMLGSNSPCKESTEVMEMFLITNLMLRVPGAMVRHMPKRTAQKETP